MHSPSLTDVLARLLWIMVGPVFLAVFGYWIIKTGNGWFTPADFAFLGILAAMIVARWLEFRGGHPKTAEGEPATAAHLRRYAIGAAVVGLSLWVAVNLVANHVLTF